MTFEREVGAYLSASQSALARLTELEPVLRDMAQRLVQALGKGRSIYLCGNGGSFAMAQHVAAELSVHFERGRPGFRAVALGSDAVEMTATSNDFGYEEVFARPLALFAESGDILLAFSTSGRSPSVLRALEVAQTKAVVALGFTSAGAHDFAAACDCCLQAHSERTAVVQEIHLVAAHALCAALDIAFETTTQARRIG